MLARARARRSSAVYFDDATPMTGIFRSPRLVMQYRAGKIFLYARSPVIPKKTSASDGTWAIGSAVSGIGPPRRLVARDDTAARGRREPVAMAAPTRNWSP